MVGGGTAGVLVALGCFLGPFDPDGIIIRSLVCVATPMVRAFELVVGKPMQQEMAIVAYLVAIPTTLVVLGAVFGLGLDWVVLLRRVPTGNPPR